MAAIHLLHGTISIAVSRGGGGGWAGYSGCLGNSPDFLISFLRLIFN